MKIGLAVQKFYTNDLAKNIAQIHESILSSKNLELDLLCFGEAVLQGFMALNGKYERDKKIAISQDSLIMEKLKDMAKDSGLAIGFGYIELDGDIIYSSYILINNNGKTIHNFRRISSGWKEHHWDDYYQEGKDFQLFQYMDKTMIIGLCGDLWIADSRLNIIKEADIVLWPIFIDDGYKEWASTALNEYVTQAGKIGKNVLLVNSILDDYAHAQGRAAYFLNGQIVNELPLEKSSILVCEIK